MVYAYDDAAHRLVNFVSKVACCSECRDLAADAPPAKDELEDACCCIHQEEYDYPEPDEDL